MSALDEAVAALPLVDHHVHGALRSTPDRPTLESMITEAPAAPTAGTQFDSQLGFAIRRWCAPLLDLAAHASADDYVARRTGLGEVEVNRRMLNGAGTATYLLDTGFLGDAILDPTEHAEASGAHTHEVVRLETLAEQLLAGEDDLVAAYPDALRAATQEAVGVKSILAYRHGFDVPADRPAPAEVRAAVARTRTGAEAPNVRDPALLRFLLWCAVDRGLPIQLHCGYGDPDLDLHRANPLLLTDWLRAVQPTGVPILLLHNYPYHREAGYLAQVFDNVHFDVGLGINHVGTQSRQLIAESFEVGPFHKQLFSSDAWGPAELHYLGAHLWRRGVTRVLGDWVAAGDWSESDAIRVLAMVGHRNAERVYGL